VAIQAQADYIGVGSVAKGYAILAYTDPDTAGVGIYARGGLAIHGVSSVGDAIYGTTAATNGVKGESSANNVGTAGVYGTATGPGANGVIGEANNGQVAYGVWGKSTSGFAGFFSGAVNVTGNFTKGGGGFKIDHPLDPENKYLRHSFVESPEALNVYCDDVVTNSDGYAIVSLPEYFSALNTHFRYQLTVIGQFAQAIVAEEINNNRFTIRTDMANVKVSWQVTGVRKDPFALAHSAPTEEAKPDAERGTYLHPESYGKPLSQGAEHASEKALRDLQPETPDTVPTFVQSS